MFQHFATGTTKLNPAKDLSSMVAVRNVVDINFPANTKSIPHGRTIDAIPPSCSYLIGTSCYQTHHTRFSRPHHATKGGSVIMYQRALVIWCACASVLWQSDIYRMESDLNLMYFICIWHLIHIMIHIIWHVSESDRYIYVSLIYTYIRWYIHTSGGRSGIRNPPNSNCTLLLRTRALRPLIWYMPHSDTSIYNILRGNLIYTVIISYTLYMAIWYVVVFVSCMKKENQIETFLATKFTTRFFYITGKEHAL
jgi:hypothetical protein